ncbi:amidohydrolase family protein [Novosphingobium sp. GV055]|nr:amidohydrolase family protein [Novosphingobium sp. GV055]PUA94359.1 amidohydrolase family protein [Novosphingobium sp. GV061]PUB12665.1 amidohydrolase family protein [Novosphingobium sp. GV079]PUB38030.1 amidohydrolase family protein [Novosphingobium sp. GV027]
MLKFIAIALLASSSAQAAAPADLVLHHGVVLTVDQDDRVVQAIAVKGGRILAVGSDADIDKHIGKDTQIIDLAGRTVTPGLIDTHAHLLENGADELVFVDLSGKTSAAQILAAVAAKAATMPPGEWV